MNTSAPLLPEVQEFSCIGNEARYQLHIPADLAYFPGHFPQQPILPGVVEVDWAVRFARRHFALPEQSFSALKNLKFSSPVLPDSTIELLLCWRPDKALLDFSYSNHQRPCASGQIVFGNSAA